jgi:transposase
MEAPLDLYGSSREELIDLVLAQRDALAEQEQANGRLRAEVATLRAALVQLTQRVGDLLAAADAAEPAGDEADGGRPTGMPGLKPGPPPARPRSPRKRRAQNFARRRMAPTHRRVHAVARCPDCGVPLAGGTPKRTREVIEVPAVPAAVTEHVYLERRCPCCRRRWVPAPELAGVVCGRSRLGIGLVGLIATLREEARLPFATIQWYLHALHGLDLSVGALVGAVARAAARAGPAVDRLRAAIRASPVVHADETGWREDGRNGYAWTFSTPTARLFVRGSREKAVLERELGPAFAGVLVSDFYVAYTHYEGRHQYCWSHLLRDAHQLAEQHRRDAAVVGWADAVHALYARARAFAAPDPPARRAAARAYEAELLALCAPYLEGGAPQAVLCRRIEKHLAELFVFVADPAVPPTNNAAERALRHLVVGRKISGGTRSAAGSTTKMRLASLFGTWRAQGLNPLVECRQLLANPQE